MGTQKKVYATPQVAVHGTLEQLTKDFKSKTFGAGDDVLVNNQSILSNFS